MLRVYEKLSKNEAGEWSKATMAPVFGSQDAAYLPDLGIPLSIPLLRRAAI
jgi:hypothetical protein